MRGAPSFSLLVSPAAKFRRRTRARCAPRVRQFRCALNLGVPLDGGMGDHKTGLGGLIGRARGWQPARARRLWLQKRRATPQGGWGRENKRALTRRFVNAPFSPWQRAMAAARQGESPASAYLAHTSCLREANQGRGRGRQRRRRRRCGRRRRVRRGGREGSVRPPPSAACNFFPPPPPPLPLSASMQTHRSDRLMRWTMYRVTTNQAYRPA